MAERMSEHFLGLLMNKVGETMDTLWTPKELNWKVNLEEQIFIFAVLQAIKLHII